MPSPHEVSDPDFAVRVEAIRPLIVSFARSRLSDPDDQDDLVQTVMIKAWTARGHYRGGSKLSTWVYSIARNELTSRLRKRQAHDRLLARLSADARFRRSTPSPEMEVLGRLTVDRLVQTLPAPSRAVFRLAYDGALTPTQIGHVLGIPAGTVRARMSRGRRQIAREQAQA